MSYRLAQPLILDTIIDLTSFSHLNNNIQKHIQFQIKPAMHTNIIKSRINVPKHVKTNNNHFNINSTTCINFMNYQTSFHTQTLNYQKYNTGFSYLTRNYYNLENI